MDRFTDLYLKLDQSTRTNEKLAALEEYFRTAPPKDSVWALYLFTGRKMGRTVPGPQLKKWAAEATGYPAWLVDECNLIAGDFSETLSLLLPPPAAVSPKPLSELIENDLHTLAHLPPPKQKELIARLWSQLNSDQRFVLHKLFGGNFRVGVSEQLVIRALAAAAAVPAAVMAHRLAGKWTPNEATMRSFLSSAADESPQQNPALPYPFMLAHALQEPLETLGPITDWLLECKWDGIRAQIIRRQGRSYLWSRGDQSVADAFPDLLHAANDLPDGTVLDGEIVAWKESAGAEGAPLPFAQLQKRLNRKRVEMSFWPEVMVVFLAFDVLESGGRDMRSDPLSARRQCLYQLLPDRTDVLLRASRPLPCATWDDIRQWLAAARETGIEGVMLKNLTSAYLPGRPTGPWWKLKVQPFSVDAVLIAAQPGRGRRAGLLTDYTFGVWEKGQLVPIAKAYSGLTDEELTAMDRYIRANSTDRYGPVYGVKPERVFEIAFEAIQRSDRHKSGIALRFPRIARLRDDKTAQQADTLDTLRELLGKRENPGGRS